MSWDFSTDPILAEALDRAAPADDHEVVLAVETHLQDRMLVRNASARIRRLA